MDIKVYKRKQYFKIVSNELRVLLRDLHYINKNLKTFKKELKRIGKKTDVITVLDKEYYIIDWFEGSIKYPTTMYDVVISEIEKLYDIDIIELKTPKGKDVVFNYNKDFKPRDYQLPYIDLILNSDNHNVLIDLPTGKGKTFTVTYALSRMKKRFGVIVLPRYIDKWRSDLEHYLDLKEDEYYVIQGSKSLRTLLAMDKNSLDKYKAFIFSLTTLNNYINEWNKHEGFTYDIEPEELTTYLDIGYIINDETHQDFYSVYKSQLYLDCNLFIGITATLVSNDRRLNKIYDIMFNDKAKLQNKVEFDRYIHVLAIKYYFNLISMKKIRYKNKIGYNQAKLEKSILMYDNIKNNYLEMIESVAYKTYYAKKDRKEKDKLLIFAGTVDMCKAIVTSLKKNKHFKDMIVNKYTEEDGYDVIEKSDIIVSTILSSGTALDINGLLSVIQTIAVDSIQANKQTIGRLRERKDKEVLFTYLWAGNVEQHRRYHKRRLEYFKDIAKEIVVTSYTKGI